MPSKQAATDELTALLDHVGSLIQRFDGSPFSKSLIRRAVLRSILHLPPNHDASEALDLLYQAMDQAALGESGRKSGSRAIRVSSLNKIWSHARNAIETVSKREARKESSTGTAM